MPHAKGGTKTVVPPNRDDQINDHFGGPMEMENLKALEAGLSIGLLTMIKAIMVITCLLAICGLATYLAGIIWLCFKEMQHSRPKRTLQNESNGITVPVPSHKKPGGKPTGRLPLHKGTLRQITIE